NFGHQFREGLQAEIRSRLGPLRAPLGLTFPLAISRVRSAYERQRRSTVGAPDQDRQRALPLFLDEASDSADVPAPFSSLSTHSTELVLAQLIDTISRENVRYAVVVATDVRDTLFLAREIRSHCSNTTLVTLEADLLYLHPDLIRWTEGMLVLTPYPLFPLSQALADPLRQRPRVQLPSSTSEGVYNAALTLVAPSEPLLDYAPPPFPGLAAAASGPGLWWSVVSRSGFLPIRHLPDAGALRPQSDALPKEHGPVLSVGRLLHSEMRVAFSLGIFLLVGVGAAVYASAHLPLTSASEPPFRSRWATDVCDDAKIGRAHV